jgi:radical SAM protein (TIGR01212 family)
MDDKQHTYPWGHSRRFNSYAEFFRKHYGERVQKLTIDAGFSCPNRDGTVGTGGCAYCNNDAFNPSYCQSTKPVRQQLEEGIEFHTVRYRKASRYLAYFQAYSNTHAPLEKLREIYDQALSVPGVTGLVIGTRPDCVDEDKLDYFESLAKRCYLTIEYGIESCNDATLLRINRGHTFAQAEAAIRQTAGRGIMTGAHLIFGLPGETRQEMMDSVDIINSLPLHSIKFHQLQITTHTPFAMEYQAHPEHFELFGLEEYLDFMVRYLERLNPAFIVERFANEVPPWFLAGPGWGLIRNFELWKMLEQRLELHDTWQGKRFRV